MKVIKDFKCKSTKRIFRKGNKYEGERGEELFNLGYLEKEEDDIDTWPKHTGGGYYELSDGTKVKGKDAAIEAQADIDGVI